MSPIDNQFLLRALKSHLDNQRLIAYHYQFAADDEPNTDTELIEAKLQAEADIQLCLEEIKNLESNSKTKTPLYYADLVRTDIEPYKESLSGIISKPKNRLGEAREFDRSTRPRDRVAIVD